MSSRFYFPFLSIVFVFAARTSNAQIWQENFSGANQGWTDNFTDCDGFGSAGVNAARYEVVDMEGSPCCPAGVNTGGGNNNEWVTNEINIQDYCNVGISVQYGFVGTLECNPGGPYFACTNDPFIDNGHDQMVFEYSLNGGAWVQFQYVCGGQTGTATATGLNGNTIRIRILPANKSGAETYWFDNVTVTGTSEPTVNPVNDITVCAGQPVNVMFSGMGTPPPTFSWTNSNTAIGLAASGNGNLNFNTPPGLGVQEIATLTVTPTSAGCTGTAETFNITVNPPPTVDDPPNVTVCPGDALSVIFTGDNPNATYNWSASLPIPGGGASGSGDINIPVIPFIPFPVSVNVTVTASVNGCTGPPQVFTISGFPTPGGNLTLTGPSSICEGQNATFSVSLSNGNAPFTFIYAIDGVNQTPVNATTSPYTLNVPITTSGAVSLVSVTASNTCEGPGSGIANITVTPAPTATLTGGSSAICTGQSQDLEINFNGSGTYNFVYRINGINQPPVTATGPTYTITASPNTPGTYTYTLASVSSNGCTGTVSGSYSLTVNQSPTATLIGGATVCAGQPTNLTIDFTGTGPFTVNYTANGDPQPPITTSNDPFLFSVAPSTTTTYELTDVTANGCPGTVQGIAVVTVNPSPTAVLTSDTVALCNGESDTLRIAFTGPGPYTFVYAVNGANQPAITTSQTIYNLIVTPTVTSNYTLVSVTGGGCMGSVSGIYRILVGTPPSATISGDTMICPGSTASLLVDFTGAAPFTFVYTANGINQPAITTSNDPYILNVMPSSITAYGLDSVSSNGCSGNTSGLATVTLSPTVSATISGGGQICTSGNGTDIFIDFVGIGPYTFTYAAGSVPVGTITTDSSHYVIHVNPPNGTTYFLDSVSNGVCGGTVSGQAIVSVFVPANAVLSGDQTFCDSANTNVMIDFAGTGPFILVYTIDGVAQPPDTTEDDPYFIPVTTTTTTTYELISVESPGCIGDPDGTATITINYAPSYSNLNLNCNQVAGTYTVTFDALGATLPLTLVTGSGTFIGTQFTSNPIPIGTPYNFVFHDANDCGDVTVSGPSNCNCLTDAGTMVLTPIEVCVGQTATATHNNDFDDDGNDILRFILHTNPASPIGTILAWNTTPSFTFGPGMTAGTTYYISAIAGNNDGAGNVDFLNDDCHSVSQGTPVIFFPLPTAEMGQGDTICVGNQAIIPITLTGVAPFSLTWSLNGGAPQTANNIPASTYQLAIQPVINTVVTLISVSDSRCTAPATDTAYIQVNTPPQVSNLTVTCDMPTQTYTLTFDVAGLPPFIVNGVGGSFTGNQFVSDPIPASSPNIIITVADANMCGQAIISDTADCSCTTDAGTMSQMQIIVCESATLNVPPATGSTLDNDDQLLYILHTNPGDPPGVILAWSNTPQFTFQPGMLANTTYYVSAIAGNPGAPGQIDLGDPCMSIAQGTPVQFHSLPTADLSPADTAICANKLVTFTVNFTGAAPFSFEYSIGSVTQPPVTGISSNLFSFTSSYAQNTAIYLVNISDQYCQSVPVQDSANITINSIPQITNVQTVCDSTGQFYAVNFTILDGQAPFTVTGITGVIDSNLFIGDAIIPSGSSYSINLNDANVCGVTFIVGSYSCACTTNAGSLGTTPLMLCAGDTATIAPVSGAFLDGNDTLLYVLATAPNPPGWTILATNSTPTFAFIPGTMSPNTTYYIVAVAGNSIPTGVDYSDICLKTTTGPTVSWRAPVTATLSGPASICGGTSSTLSVAFTGAGPYSLVYNNGTQQTVNTSQNPYSLTVAPAANATSISLVSVNGAGACPGTVNGSVAVAPTPQALNVQTTCDFTTQTYQLQFNISNGAAPNTTYTVSGVMGTMNDTTFTSNAIPGAQPYNVTITNPTGCSTSIAGESNCICTTDAGTLTAIEADGCLPSGQVSVQISGQVLETDDALQYILYQDPAQLPLGIIAVSNTPQFGFQTGMTAGTTYYVSAMAGNNDGAGNVDTSDVCLSISAGVPVVFHDPPTATLSGSASFCAGGNAAFQIQFTGTAPFKFVYAVNGNAQPAITAPGNTFSISTNNVQQNQVFTLISVEDKFCAGTVSGQATVDVIPPPTGSLIGDATICAGSTTTLGLILSGGTSYDVTISGGASPIVLNGVQDGATVDVTPTTTTTYTITNLVATGNNCPSDIGTGVTVTLSDLSATATISNYNGFGVSCPNGDDGSVSITPVGGIPEITATWSNGNSGLQISNLAPGSYTVTLTDQIGCIWIDSFLLTAPPGLTIDVSTTSPTCFGDKDGSLTIESIMGGAKPFTLTLDGSSLATIDTFPITLGQLEAGDYLLEVADANGCVTEDSVNVAAPPQLIVDLGQDTTINFGDSIRLEALLNMTAYDTFAWSPVTYLQTPDSLSTMVRPPQSQIYNITVIDTTGCPARDDIRIVVQKSGRVYLPNIIKPESIELNDFFTVFTGAEVTLVRTMQIYDRWGELLFKNEDFAPNQPQLGWNGRANGDQVNPGVFVYVVEVEYFDGSTEVFSGDVTVVR